MQLAFPEVDPGVTPFGSRILVQIRVPKRLTKGGIIVPDEARDTDKDNTKIAKVLALGPLAFKNRNTMESWPEGQWVKPGDFVMVPLYAGTRWQKKIEGTEDYVEFVIFDDLNMIGLVQGDPLSFKAWI